MDEIIPFTFGAEPVRVIKRGDDPWWVLADVCGVLEINNPRDAARRLDDDEKAKIDVTLHVGNIDGGKFNDLGVGDGNNEAWIINESGLYSLILTSRKKQAKAFKKWITSEVLPSIRKTGGYGPQALPYDLPTLVAAVSTASLPALVPTLLQHLAPLIREEVTNQIRSDARVAAVAFRPTLSFLIEWGYVETKGRRGLSLSVCSQLRKYCKILSDRNEGKVAEQSVDPSGQTVWLFDVDSANKWYHREGKAYIEQRLTQIRKKGQGALRLVVPLRQRDLPLSDDKQE